MREHQPEDSNPVAAKRRRGGRPPVPRTLETLILNCRQEVIGWTCTSPEFLNGELRHFEAEAILGGHVLAVYVRLDNVDDARRAGAPPDWNNPWRCLGLCSADFVSVIGSDEEWTLRPGQRARDDAD